MSTTTTMSLDNVLSLVIHEDVYERWRHLGSMQGFSSDAEIASYLLQYFESSRAQVESERCCINCQMALPPLCKVCESAQQQQMSQQHQQQQHEYPSPSQPTHSLTVTEGSSQAQPPLHPHPHPHPPTSQDAEAALALVEVPQAQEIVFIDASNTTENNAEKLLFTNVHVVTEGEVEAGSVSVVDLNVDLVKPETIISPPIQTADSSQTQTKPSIHDSGQDASLSVDFEKKGEPFSAKVFHISDMDKLEVGAIFTTCERRVRRVKRPPQLTQNTLSAPARSIQTPKGGSEIVTQFEDSAQDETGAALSEEEEDGEGEEEEDEDEDEEEEEESGDGQLLPPLFIERRKPYSTRKTWGRPPYLCQTCGASFNSTSTLSRHIFKHTGERPFPCPQCSAAFVSKPELRNHFRKHTGEKPFLCPICGSAFDRSTNLNTHMRTHTGERPYKCDQCGACFTTSSSLNRHKRIHTGEKPYVCSQCDAAFPQLGHLKDHVQRHTGAKPFQCQDCGSTFCTRARLMRHQRKVQCTGASSEVLA